MVAQLLNCTQVQSEAVGKQDKGVKERRILHMRRVTEANIISRLVRATCTSVQLLTRLTSIKLSKRMIHPTYQLFRLY